MKDTINSAPVADSLLRQSNSGNYPPLRISGAADHVRNTLGESSCPGWNQLSTSLKSRPRDDRNSEYFEMYWFHQNHLKSLFFIDFSDFGMTSDLDSKERPTKTIQNVKMCFKLSQILGKCSFSGWNQLSNSLKLRPRDDRHNRQSVIEYLEMHRFPQNL